MTPPADKQPQLDSIAYLFSSMFHHTEVKSNNDEILSVNDWRGLFLSMCISAWPCIWYFPEIMFLKGSDWRCITALPGGKEIPCRFFLLENFWSVFPLYAGALSTYGWSLTGLLKVSKQECDISIGLYDVSGSIYCCGLTLKKD